MRKCASRKKVFGKNIIFVIFYNSHKSNSVCQTSFYALNVVWVVFKNGLNC